MTAFDDEKKTYAETKYAVELFGRECYTAGLRRGAEIVASMKPSKYEKDKNKQCSHCEECCELIEKVILAEAEKEGKV